MLDGVPKVLVTQPLAPVGWQGLIEEVCPILMQEGGRVHSIGDIAHWILFGTHFGPLVGSEARRDGAVNATHRIHAARAVQRETRHVEEPGHSRRSTELEKTLDRDTELANEVGEMRNE